MKFKEFNQNSLRFAANLLLYNAAEVLCKSLRISLINIEPVKQLENSKQNYVFAFWHGSMLVPWYLNRNKNFAALTSKSKDGDLLARLLKNWRYKVVRGSSSTGGDVALGIMIDYAKNKYSIAVTPDGPRGPAHKLKAGAVITAKKAGIPLILAGVGFQKKRILKSWDKFEIPALFAKTKIIFSDPIYIDKSLNYEETSEVINNCENKLNQLQQEANIF